LKFFFNGRKDVISREYVKEIVSVFETQKFYDMRCMVCRGNFRIVSPVPRYDDYKKGFSYVCSSVTCAECIPSNPVEEKTGWLTPYYKFVLEHTKQTVRSRSPDILIRRKYGQENFYELPLVEQAFLKRIFHRVRHITFEYGMACLSFDTTISKIPVEKLFYYVTKNSGSFFLEEIDYEKRVSIKGDNRHNAILQRYDFGVYRDLRKEERSEVVFSHDELISHFDIVNL